MCKDRFALVTGASRGLGSNIAFTLAKNGYTVFGCARSASKLEDLSSRAAERGLVIRPIVADITDPSAVDDIFNQVSAYTDSLDVCINNAGTNRSCRLVRYSRENSSVLLHPLSLWYETIELCLSATFLVGRKAAEMMIAKGNGVIVNISSSVRQGAFSQSAYAASKAGVASLTKTWAYELGQYGVRCVCVSPGVIDGERLNEKIAANPKHAQYMLRLKSTLPLGEWCTPEEIVDAVIFAISNRSLNGSILEVDGGGIPPRVW